MAVSDLFLHDRCDRCDLPTSARIMSYFTEEIICMQCLGAERELIHALKRQGVDTVSLASCGYLPEAKSFAGGERRAQ